MVKWKTGSGEGRTKNWSGREARSGEERMRSWLVERGPRSAEPVLFHLHTTHMCDQLIVEYGWDNQWQIMNETGDPLVGRLTSRYLHQW